MAKDPIPDPSEQATTRPAPPLPSHDGDHDDALSPSAIPPLPPQNEGS